MQYDCLSLRNLGVIRPNLTPSPVSTSPNPAPALRPILATSCVIELSLSPSRLMVAPVLLAVDICTDVTASRLYCRLSATLWVWPTRTTGNRTVAAAGPCTTAEQTALLPSWACRSSRTTLARWSGHVQKYFIRL